MQIHSRFALAIAVSLGLACSGGNGGGAGSPTAPSTFSISAAGVTAVFHQDTVTITAQGCSSTVTWSAPEGAPSTGQGNTFEVFWWPGFGEQTATVTATCGGEQRALDIDVLFRAGVCGFVETLVSQCSSRINLVDGARNGYDHEIAITFRAFIRRGDGSIRVIGKEPSIVPSWSSLATKNGGVRIDKRDGSTECTGNIPGHTPTAEACGEAAGILFSFYRASAGLIDLSAKLRPDQLFEGEEFRHQLTCIECG